MLQERTAMDSAFQWDTSVIFADRAAWEKEYEELSAGVNEIGRFSGRLGEGAAVMAEALDLYFEFMRRLEILYIYGMLKNDEDGSVSASQEMVDKAQMLFAKASMAGAFVGPEIVALSQETIDAYLQAPELKEYDVFIKNTYREKEHSLSAEQEELLAGMGEFSGTPRATYAAFTNVDMPLPIIKDKDGREQQLTAGNFGAFRESADRVLRENAFNGMFGTYKSYENTFAKLYGGSVKTTSYMSRVRKYSDARSAKLFGDNVPASVYDSLIEAVRNAGPITKKYLELRKKALKLEKLDYYDLYVPMLPDIDMGIKYEDAQGLIYEATKPLGAEYRTMLETAFANRWIDVYENKGKRSGAYSCGIFGIHPFILMSYSGTLDSAFTLIHELGHSMHSYFSSKTQPFAKHDYTIMAAEVASTTNEMFLLRHLMKTETDKARRAAIINHFLESIRTTLIRQTLFAEFEREAYKMSESGAPLTAKALSELYRSLLEAYYPGLEIPENAAYEWSFIPHFYTPFYVFQYATGISSAITIVDQILESGNAEGYMKFLTTGGSEFPIDELKYAGVDLTKPDAVARAMKLFEESIEELSQLLDEL